MRMPSFAVAALSLSVSAWAAVGGFLHEIPAGEAFLQVEKLEFAPAVTKALLQDGRAAQGWDAVDTRRPYCVLVARAVSADRPMVLKAGSEHEVEFVDHKWLDFPYGAACATSFSYKGGDLAGMICLKPSVYADDYLTLTEFEAVAGGVLRLEFRR